MTATWSGHSLQKFYVGSHQEAWIVFMLNKQTNKIVKIFEEIFLGVLFSTFYFIIFSC